MIKIKHAQSSLTMSVTKGAYNQVYKPLGWDPVEVPVEQTVPQPVSTELVAPAAPKKRKARAVKE